MNVKITFSANSTNEITGRYELTVDGPLQLIQTELQ